MLGPWQSTCCEKGTFEKGKSLGKRTWSLKPLNKGIFQKKQPLTKRKTGRITLETWNPWKKKVSLMKRENLYGRGGAGHFKKRYVDDVLPSSRQACNMIVRY